MAKVMGNAKIKTFETLRNNGWVLDSSVTRHERTDIKYDQRTGRREDVYTDVQNHLAFTRPAAHGGSWHILLDYTNRSSWRATEGDTLQKIDVHYRDANGRVVNLDLGYNWGTGRDAFTLVNSDRSRYTSTSWLWEATGRTASGDTWYSKNGDKTRSLRERAEVFLKDPDLAVWVAILLKADEDRRQAEQAAAEKADAIARAQALPITVEQGKYYWYEGTFKALAHALKNAADDIENADGKSDLPQLVANAQLALGAIRGVLTEAAENTVHDLLVTHAHPELVNA